MQYDQSTRASDPASSGPRQASRDFYLGNIALSESEVRAATSLLIVSPEIEIAAIVLHPWCEDQHLPFWLALRQPRSTTRPLDTHIQREMLFPKRELGGALEHRAASCRRTRNRNRCHYQARDLDGLDASQIRIDASISVLQDIGRSIRGQVLENAIRKPVCPVDVSGGTPIRAATR